MWGVAKLASGDTKCLESWPDLEAAWRDSEAVVWIDLESPSPDDLTRLDGIIDLDDAALADCLDGEPRPRIEDYGPYLLVVAYGAYLPQEGADELEPRKLAVFRGPRFLVTVHTQPSRSVKALRSRCERNAAALLGLGVDHMLHRLIDGMIDRYLMLLDAYEGEVEEFEERSFDPPADGRLLQEAGRIRRHLIEVRRLVGGQRSLLEPLAQGDFDYLSKGIGKQFHQVESHLLHAHDRVVGLQERLGAAVQNYHASVAMHTNEVMRGLTALTAAMLPMSLIAGVYGMNFPLWPATDSPWGFWGAIGAMTLTGVTSLAVFKALRWV